MVKVYQAFRIVETEQYSAYHDLTRLLESEVEKSGIKNGLISVNVLHTTAAIALQEPDPTVHEDGREVLSELIPTTRSYHHNYEGNINGAAHQKQLIVGNSRTIPVKNGKLVLGTWQKVFLVELFQPMQRKVFITIIGE